MRISLMFFVLLLFSTCKTIEKKVSHPLLREDGFYYRQKNRDLYQVMRFYSNGRVAVNDIFTKEERFSLYQNKIMCCLDTMADVYATFADLTVNNFTLQNDSIHFVKKCSDRFFKYNLAYSCMIYADSIDAELHALEVDSVKMKTSTTRRVSFKFVKAKCDPNQVIPKDPNYQWGLDKERKL